MIAELATAGIIAASAAGAIVFGVRKWALDSREERRKEAEERRKEAEERRKEAEGHRAEMRAIEEGLRTEMRAIEGRLRADAKEREERFGRAIGALDKKIDGVCDRVTRVEAGLAELRDIVLRRGQGGEEPRAGA